MALINDLQECSQRQHEALHLMQRLVAECMILFVGP